VGLTLVIGGTRSGKSRRGEALAAARGGTVRYVATADGSDPSMTERIAAHAARRPEGWVIVEAGARLAEALGPDDGSCVLVDGLGPWLARALERAGAFEAADARDARADVLADLEALCTAARAGRSVIVVAEEAGHGLLPAECGSRLWLDLLGEATQLLGAAAEHAELVVAGRPLALPRGVAPPVADELRVHGDSLVRAGDADHAVNVLAGDPPQWMRAALERALADDVARYPDERDAVQALAALHGRDPAEIVPTNGATQALWLLPAALRPALGACVHPGFTEAEAALRAHGIPVARVLRDEQRGFALDPAAVPDACELVVVGNPASPSGTLDPATAILALRRPGRIVAVDEAFMDLVPGEPESLVRDAPDDIVVIRSMTKSLSLPGMRVGYAVAAPPVAERLRALRPPWSVNALALAALAAAARHPEHLAANAQRAQAEREDLEHRLHAIPRVRTWPASANFCLVAVPDAARVARALRAQRIAVRPAASFPGLNGTHLRLTARDPQANARLADALAAAVEACS
jgi:histidinol-phosphate/aromatic aminotransferase/cobyric acid decarboxylase-like protein/adenosyl cobinamide kinase/adenosyl cobinamide phosphate guanylyltransferase